MPKKMGTNSKALEARERKQTEKKTNQDKAKKEADDKLWQDDDRNLAKKKQRKEEEERKKADAIKRKAEAKLLLDEEISSIKVKAKQSIQKVTRQQVMEEIEKRNRNIELMAASAKKAPERIVEVQAPEENLNRVMADTLVASNVDQALAVLSVKDDEDKHPERRVRAALKEYEKINLPRIKAENPHLRLSQWKQILMKEWNKSPDNPFNKNI